MIDSLSVFFPTYNEEGNLAKTVTSAKNVLEKLKLKKWEIIIVDDGSRDKTPEIAASLAKKNKNIHVVTNNPNRGYGGALKAGLYNAKYDWIAFTDSDGQFDFSEIINFIETQKERKADIVIGYYKDRKVSFDKKLTSKMWEYLVFFLFGLKVRDIDCGFKFLSRKIIKKLPALESERGAFISSELLIKAKRAGAKIVEIPVTHYPRVKGQGTGRNLDVILKSFSDLARLRAKLANE